MEQQEKRTARVQGYIPPSLKGFVAAQIAASGGLKTESDVVFEALELKRVIVAAEHGSPRLARRS